MALPPFPLAALIQAAHYSEMIIPRSFLFVLLIACVITLPAPATAEHNPAAIDLPDGFSIETFVEVPGARSISVAREIGAVFVGTRDDTVYGFHVNGGVPGLVRPVLTNLKVPNGVLWHDGWLYVAEQHRIVRYTAFNLEVVETATPEILFDDLPDDRWHGWRYMTLGPDGMLYVSVGAPCNVCETGGLEGTIIRINPEGGEPEIFATGVRNSVGLDFHPHSGELHFTDNGADRMGDDSPPDELNHAPVPGLDFGFPVYGGGADRTPQFDDQPIPKDAVFPEIRFGAHVAALGIHFYRGDMFPEQYRSAAFVAQHGSWNRSVPDGYRIVRVDFDAKGKATSYKTFADGWLMSHGQVWGRPVDIKELPDGSLLVSDDNADVIYRITFDKDW